MGTIEEAARRVVGATQSTEVEAGVVNAACGAESKDIVIIVACRTGAIGGGSDHQMRHSNRQPLQHGRSDHLRVWSAASLYNTGSSTTWWHGQTASHGHRGTCTEMFFDR
jgi:hypothetical protein